MTVMSLRGLPVPAERRQQQAAPGTGARPRPGSTTDRRSRGRGPATARSGPEYRGGAGPSCWPRPFRTRPGSGPPPVTIAVGEATAALPWLVCEDVEPSAAPATVRGEIRRSERIGTRSAGARGRGRGRGRGPCRGRARVRARRRGGRRTGRRRGPDLGDVGRCLGEEGVRQRCHPRRQVVLTPVDEESQPLAHRCLGGGVRGAIAVEQRLSRGDGVLDVGEWVGLDAVHGSAVRGSEARCRRVAPSCSPLPPAWTMWSGRRRSPGREWPPSASRASAGRSRRDHPRSPLPWRRR